MSLAFWNILLNNVALILESCLSLWLPTLRNLLIISCAVSVYHSTTEKKSKLSSRDYLYAQPIRIKPIEAIRIALVKYGALKPSDKRRFLTPKEAQKLKAKWRSCKNVREFIALSKLRPRHALRLELFMDIHQK